MDKRPKTKVCTKCGKRKSLDAGFYYAKRGKWHKYASCKKCHNTMCFKWVEINREKRNETTRLWAKRNPKKIRQFALEHAQKNQKTIKNYWRNHYYKNKYGEFADCAMLAADIKHELNKENNNGTT